MIKKYTFFLLVLVTICIAATKAQPVLQPISLPVSGDLWSNKHITDTSIQAGPGGTGVIWNFSNFIVNPGVISESFATPNGTGNDAFFPTANLKVNSLFSGFDYYIKSANSLQYLGTKSSTNEVLISNQQFLMTVPFQYGDSISNPAVTGTGFGYALTGTISVKADGTGDLTLYTGAFTNTLRVKTDMNLVLGAGTGIDTYIHIEKYTWYSQFFRAPVFQIAVFDMNGVLGTFHQKVTTVSTLTTDVATLSAISDNKFILYPNPASEFTSLNINSLTDEKISVKISDATGRIMREFSIDDFKSSTTIDLSGLANGIYFVAVTKDGLTTSQRLIIE